MKEPYRRIGEGSCRYGSDQSDHIEEVATASLKECYNECKQTTGCTAFSFQSEHGRCKKWRNGPYTHGSGSSGIECYILGISTLFNAFLHMNIVKVLLPILKKLPLL